MALDDGDDGEFDVYNQGQSVSPPPALPIMPPPPPMSAMFDGKTGTFHPDFMFCGTCTDCQPLDSSKSELDVEEKLETYLDDASVTSEVVVLETKLMLRNPITNPSQGLVIQSLLQPLPGVTRVFVESGEPSSVTIGHDASTSTEGILSALESVGHFAFVQAPKVNPGGDLLWVRSQFYVKGICCASEVPAVKRIVKPMLGVSKLQINITTKMVHVQHDVSIVSAQQIADKLSREGFPTTIQKDGQGMAQAKKEALHIGRTTLHVQGVLTDGDVPKIQQQLNQTTGVTKIGVNVSEGVIYVDHDIYSVTSTLCVERLKPNFTCVVAIAGEKAAGDAAASALNQIGKSKYVESTLMIPDMQTPHLKILEKAISQNFIRAQVRAIYPNLVSKTIKVEHDPSMVPIRDIVATLSNYHLEVTVTVDGEDLNLYLPVQEDYPSNQVAYGEEPSLMQIHANVWLSGIFWVLSILSYRDGWDNFKYFGLLSVLFGLPPIFVKAWRTLRRCQFDANCMMVTAAVGALALQEYDEAASVSFLFSVSEYLEAKATARARRALGAICNLRPDHANVIHPVTKEIIVVPADRVPLGSLISVKTGDKIAADGVVVEGSSAIDESSLTGESRPVHKLIGDEVKGGTINVGVSQLVIRTTTTVEDSAVARLIRLVEEAQSNRSPTEKMIDSFARSYTPSVMFMAVLMCTLPWAWGAEVGRYWTLNGLIIIVIACPCALTISTPVTYAAGLAATAQRGVIIKGGSKLEAMGSVDRIVFDKTGTLTMGKFSVIHLEVIGNTKTRQEMLELLSLLQERSSHPLSATLVQAAKEEGVKTPRHVQLTEHTILKGEGVTAKADGKSVYVGNQRLFDRLRMYGTLPLNYQDLVKTWSGTGGSVGFIGTEEDGIIGAFCVKDAIRKEAAAVIQGFRDARIDTIMCTGDSNAAAHAVAKEIGIPRGAVHSQLLPEDKLHFVGSLKRPQPKNFTLCREKRYVLFCGDGVNDAPALAVADIGASMGEGAAMAMEMSDVTLMDSNLSKLLYAIKMGRRVVRTIQENIFLSLAAKLVVVGLTFVGKMTLLVAIASDVGIMLVVTLNGMKLLPSKNLDPTLFTEVTSPDKKQKELEMASLADNATEIV